MKTPEHIDSLQPDPDGLDFDALRKAGIAMLQELSGDRWTDYNLHDPGVTILEQYCYALTDLAYRSEFDPEDYLAGPFGRIDLERHALHPADQVLPSQVLTADDYRKLIYDRVPEIEDVWLELAPAGGEAPPGLYRIGLKIRESLQADLHPEEQQALERSVHARVLALYHAHRNLGEDLARINIVGTRPVFLCGDIQIHSQRDPAAIFADIFFRCALEVMSGFRVERYQDGHDAGVPLASLFEGPRTLHGRILHTGAAAPGAGISIARLIALAQEVDGVANVLRLSLCDQHGQPLRDDGDASRVLRLRFPAQAQSGFLRLHFASGAVGHYDTDAATPREAAADRQLQTDKERAVLDEAQVALRKVRFEFDTARNTVQSLEHVAPAPQGVPRALNEYYSIQHQFPAIYGINRFGVPQSAPLASKVSARQLKAYLYPAEQLMANYLENLKQIPSVFSLEDTAHTYFSRLIDDEALPDIETLYVDPPARSAERLGQAVAGMDRAHARRGRLLDVMLAMYGEEFSQRSLRRFNYYEDSDTARWLLNNKLNFVRNIVALGRDRATAIDITHGQRRADGSFNQAGVHAKIAILLGLPMPHGDPEPSAALADAGLLPMEGDFPAHAYQQGTEALEQALAREARAPDQPEKQAGAVRLPAKLLTQGARLENYLLEQHGDDIHVHFQSHDPVAGKVWLGKHPDLAEAERHMRRLRDFLRRLNMASEGFYLVEHVLLRRRRDPAGDAEAGAAGADDFHGPRVSIVFPGWSARFSDPDFRVLAQETVCRNLPAHLYPEFHWLSLPAMRDFEQRYRAWREQLRSHAERLTPGQADHAADRLARFLRRYRGAGNQTYWV